MTSHIHVRMPLVLCVPFHILEMHWLKPMTPKEGQSPEDEASLSHPEGLLDHLIPGLLRKGVVVGQMNTLLQAAQSGSHSKEHGERQKKSAGPLRDEPAPLGPAQLLDGGHETGLIDRRR